LRILQSHPVRGESLLFKSSIGIEINDLQINIVYLKGSFKSVHPPVASSCRMEPGRSVQDRQSDIISFVNGFIRENKITASDVFIGISAVHTMMREIAFPLAVRENLRATLAYEIEKYIPMSADDIHFDYQIISENKDVDTLKLLLVAVKKDVLAYYLEIAEGLDIGVSGIEIIPAAIANYCVYHQEPQQEPHLIVFSKDAGYDAAVLKSNSLVYAKSVTIPETPDNNTFVRDQCVRLRNIFFPDEENVRVVLYGVSESDGLAAQLSQEFPHVISGVMHMPNRGGQFIPAFGLALNGIVDRPVEMNLMPVRLRKKPNKTGIYVMFALAGLLLLSGLGWAGSHLMIQRQILQGLDAELTRLRTEAAAVEKIQSETQQFKKNVMYIRSLRPGGVYIVEIAEELSRIIPPDAYLTEIKLDENKLSLFGIAESASGLISLLEESSLFEGVEFLAAIRKDRDGKEVFRIGCIINAGK
jgi:Tfp pilus assembly protein PilN